MKKIIILAAVVALISCSKASETVPKPAAPVANKNPVVHQEQITVPIYEMPKTPSKSKY